METQESFGEKQPPAAAAADDDDAAAVAEGNDFLLKRVENEPKLQPKPKQSVKRCSTTPQGREERQSQVIIFSLGSLIAFIQT